MIKYNVISNGSNSGWWPYDNGGKTKVKGKLVTESAYMRAEAEATDSTTALLSGLSLEAGRYKITADVRMTKYDFNNYTVSGTTYTNKNAGNVTFSGANGVAVLTTEATAIDNEWKAVSFEIDVPAAAANGEVSFVLDNALGLDINNVYVTKTASYGDFADGNGNPILKLSEANKEYVHLTDINSPDDELKYYSDIALDTSKTYILTMDMRAATSVNWGTYYSSNGGRSSGDSVYKREIQLNVAGITGKNAPFISIGTEWEQVKYEFKPVNSTFSLVIKEGSGNYGFYDLIPYDVDNLKLTEKASGNVLIEAGSAEVIGSEASTGFYSTNATAVLETEYYRLEDSSLFSYTGDELLQNGIQKGIYKSGVNFFTESDKINTKSTYYDYRAGSNKGMWNVLTQLGSYEKVIKLNRRNILTYKDTQAVWQSRVQYLPKTVRNDSYSSFRIPVGDVLDGSVLTLKFSTDNAEAFDNPPIVYVNSVPCTYNGLDICKGGHTENYLMCYDIPEEVHGDTYMVIEIMGGAKYSFQTDYMEIYVKSPN